MILATQNLSKRFGEVHAVDDVTLQVPEGGITSTIGPNGAGKTTLIHLITGRLKPDSGKIIFEGREITQMAPYERVSMGIARSFQIVDVYNELTVFDNVRIAVISRLKRTGRIFSLLERDKDVAKETFEILELMGLREKGDMPASKLDHGDRKLLDVALPFALQPRLILLDEPTSGVSTREKGKVMDVIASAVKERNVTALIVEHDMDIVFSYSNRVIAMHQGKVIADGKPEEIRECSDVKSTILGVEIR